MDDKFRVDYSQNLKVRFSLIGPETAVPFDRVTSVGVVPFTADGCVVAIIQPRGIDIPGGHVQHGEHTLHEVAEREAREEACIAISQSVLVGYLESNYFGDDNITYIAVLTALVGEVGEFFPSQEASERVICSPEEFLSRYNPDNRDAMTALFFWARTALAIDSGSPAGLVQH